MDETKALERLKKGDERALEWFVRRYTPYVGAVVWAVIGGRLSAQDGEEVAADVFLTLWRNRAKVRESAVRGYLGAIARSRAIDRLRRASALPELEYDELDGAVDGPESGVLAREERQALPAAVDGLGEPDREIFLRWYYLCQSAPDIGEKLGMTAWAAGIIRIEKVERPIILGTQDTDESIPAIEVGFDKTEEGPIAPLGVWEVDMPAGYEKSFSFSKENYANEGWTSGTGGGVTFTYRKAGTGLGDVTITEAELKEKRDVTVNGQPGTLYATEEGSMLAWTDQEAGVGFTMLSSDEALDLLALAESVEKVE